MKSGSSTASIADPTPVLFLIVIMLAMVWVIGDTSWPSLLAAGAVSALGAIALLLEYPWAGVVILTVAAAIPRLAISVSGGNVRPEHIAAGLMLLALPFWIKRFQPAIRWITADYLLIAYVALNIFSSLFMSVAPSQTLKWCAQQVLVILSYPLLRIFITTPAAFRRAVRLLLAVGTLASLYAVIAFYSGILFKTQFGIEPGQYDSAIGPAYGTQYEANILGAYCGATSLMMLVMYLAKRDRKLLAGFTLTFIGMAISLSRAALTGTVLVLLVVLIQGMKLKQIKRKMLAQMGVAALCVAVLTAPVLIAAYSERFSTVEIADPTADASTVVRLIGFAVAWDGISNHPIAGNGTASFQLSFSWADLEPGSEAAGSISNTELRVLHDTGVLGLGVFMSFVLAVAGGAWKLLKRTPSPELLALCAGALVYSFSFQFTEGTLLAFPWVQLGIIGCALAIAAPESQKDAVAAGSSAGVLR